MNREQISEGNVKYLLLADWPAKLCILLPVVLADLSLGNAVKSIVAGILLWCLVIGVAQRRIRPGEDFFRILEERAGKGTAVVFCTVSLWYFLAHTAVFARIWSELLRTYLMPFVPGAVLCALPLAAGLVCLRKGLAFRARICRRTGIALLVLSAGFAFLVGSEVPTGAYRSVILTAGAQSDAYSGGMAAGALRDLTVSAAQSPAEAVMRAADGFARSAYEVFLCLGGMFLPLLSGHLAGKRCERADEAMPADFGKGRGRKARERAGRGCSVRIAGSVCAAAAGVFCLASGLLLTARERSEDDYPAIEALSRLQPFGIDAGRLETVLVLFLLAGLMMTVAGGLWHVRESFDYLYAAWVSFYYEDLCEFLRRKYPGILQEWPLLRVGSRAAGRRPGKGASEPVHAGGQKLYDTEFAGELYGTELIDGLHEAELADEFHGTAFTDGLHEAELTDELHGTEFTDGLHETEFADEFYDTEFVGRIRSYGEKISDRLSAARVWRWIVMLAVYALTLGFADAFAAITFYRAYNMQILIPAMLILYAALSGIVRGRREAVGAAEIG